MRESCVKGLEADPSAEFFSRLRWLIYCLFIFSADIGLAVYIFLADIRLHNFRLRFG